MAHNKFIMDLCNYTKEEHIKYVTIILPSLSAKVCTCNSHGNNTYTALMDYYGVILDISILGNTYDMTDDDSPREVVRAPHYSVI